MIEHVVLVDEENVVLGTAPKLESHHERTPLHRGFSVFLFNGSGELLMQQRSGSKKTWPLVWSNSCCGHPMLGESVVDAAVRRMADELGLRGVAPRVVVPFYRYRHEKDGVVENEICPVMVAFADCEPVPNAGEVESTRWVPWEGFLRMTTSDAGLSPWCVDEAVLLARSELFDGLYRGHCRPALAQTG
jgi:isopentenyl-diphosphate Delta-isomerase